jgi:uncharacterized protein (DUF1697 family)
MAETYVALLRGINVGGKNKLSMTDLVALFEEAGVQDVRTYIQSGNVLFAASRGVVDGLAKAVTGEIEVRFGLKVPVVVRSLTALEAVVEANPYRHHGSTPKALHVMFLMDEPPAPAVAALDRHRSPPDEFALLGREVFLYCPNGLGRSKLTTAWFDQALGTVSTVRNWNTVNTLVDMCRGR